ncbi:MAG: hypothetical protein AAF417_22710, partial [Pseudomonadota bacterium]
PDDEKTLWGFNARPRVGLETHTPRTDIYLNGLLNYGYFPERTDENSLDLGADASLRHRTERSVFSLAGNVARATTRTTEIEDSGRDLSDSERISVGGNGSWSYSLTERMAAGIQGGGSYVTYDTNQFDDFRTLTGGTFATYQVTQQDSVRVNATYTNFETLTGPDNTSDVVVVNGVWTHVFHPQWQASLTLGGNYTSEEEDVQVGNTTVTQKDNQFGFDAGASVTYTEERGSISGSFTHGIAPSGVGRLVRRNALTLNTSYRATPTITFGFSTSFIQQEALSGSSDDRNFVSAEPGVSWQFLPEWSARVAYRFRTQQLDDEGRAYSNGGLASVTWQLPSWGPNKGK